MTERTNPDTAGQADTAALIAAARRRVPTLTRTRDRVNVGIANDLAALASALEASVAERLRLESLIDEAEHTSACDAWADMSGSDCTCFKSRAGDLVALENEGRDKMRAVAARWDEALEYIEGLEDGE